MPPWSRLPWVWGPAAEGAAQPQGRHERVARRAVLVAAEPPVVFRWLCQLRLAPYSYDWLDNRGRRSPRALVAGCEELTAGDQIMDIFTLVSIEPDRSLRLSLTDSRATRLLGPFEVEYRCDPAAGGTLLSARLEFGPARGALGRLRDEALLWGDLVMMRKQLQTLGSLAEQPGIDRDVTADPVSDGPRAPARRQPARGAAARRRGR